MDKEGLPLRASEPNGIHSLDKPTSAGVPFRRSTPIGVEFLIPRPLNLISALATAPHAQSQGCFKSPHPCLPKYQHLDFQSNQKHIVVFGAGATEWQASNFLHKGVGSCLK
jgi:hypothetical protein